MSIDLAGTDGVEGEAESAMDTEEKQPETETRAEKSGIDSDVPMATTDPYVEEASSAMSLAPEERRTEDLVTQDLERIFVVREQAGAEKALATAESAASQGPEGSETTILAAYVGPQGFGLHSLLQEAEPPAGPPPVEASQLPRYNTAVIHSDTNCSCTCGWGARVRKARRMFP